MKAIIAQLFLAVMLYVSVAAQPCLLVKQTTSRFNAEDQRLGATKTTATTYHYDKLNRLDTMVSEWGQVYNWTYTTDTVTMHTGTAITKKVQNYLLNKRGKVLQMEMLTDLFANDTSEVRISTDMAVSTYLYNDEGTLTQIVSFGNNERLNKKTGFVWNNGNKLYDEYSTNGKVKDKQLYEYYEDLPYQVLYPDAVNLGDHTRNLIKKTTLLSNGVPIMSLSFQYEFNKEGLINKLTTVSSTDNHKTVTEFTYDCR